MEPVSADVYGVGACFAQGCKVGGEDRGRDDGGRGHGGDGGSMREQTAGWGGGRGG